MSDISILGIVLNKNEDLKNQEEAYKDLCAFGKTNHCMPFTTIISKAAGATTAKICINLSMHTVIQKALTKEAYRES